MKNRNVFTVIILCLVFLLVLSLTAVTSANGTHTVKYVTYGHIADIPSQTVPDGDNTTMPAGYTYDDKADDYATTGLYFRGWYTVETSASTSYLDLCYDVANGGKSFNFKNTPITGDITLYAWYYGFPVMYCYDLNAQAQGGGKFSAVTPYMNSAYESTGYHQAIAMLDAGMACTAEPKENYHFVGWSTSSSPDDIINTDKKHTFLFTPKMELYALFDTGEAVEKPAFTPASGTYSTPQNVTISCETDGARIYYTTDGSKPTAGSTEYTGAISVKKTATIKAIAIKNGLIDSNIAEATYTITEASSSTTPPSSDPTTPPPSDPSAPAVRDEVTVSGGVYKLNDAKGTAVFTGPAKKTAAKLTVKDTVSANGKTYKVTEIKARACRGMKKLTTVTIGKNVTKIGKSAFEKCAKLKKITIKNAKMKKAGFGANCFKGINAKAAFKVPKKVLKNYTAWIKSKGKAPKTATVKK